MLTYSVVWNSGRVLSSITYEGFRKYSPKGWEVAPVGADVYLVVCEAEGDTELWLVMQDKETNGFKSLQQFYEMEMGYPFVKATALLLTGREIYGMLNEMARG